MSRRSLERIWRVGDQVVSAELALEAGELTGALTGIEGGEAVHARVRRGGPDSVLVRMGGRVHRAVLVRQGPVIWVAVDGHTYELRVESGASGSSRNTAEPFAVSPMTGVLAKVNVARGQTVSAGDELFVVEAMKMEFSVKAARDAVVAEVRGQQGGKVSLGEPVVAFEGEA